MADRLRFLDGVTLRPVKLPPGSNLKSMGLALGNGASALEVLVASHHEMPAPPSLRLLWKARKGGRAAPVLVVALCGDKVALCGPGGEDPPVRIGLDPGQVDRICREALEQPDRHAALRSLRDSLPAVESELGGIRNEGFLATHELKAGARQRKDWEECCEKGLRVIPKQGRDMLLALGFEIQPCDRVTSILRAGQRKVAVAVLLLQDESPELQADRFSNLSPISYGLAVAERENLPYVVLQHSRKIRVYPRSAGVGVGRRGPTETYVECHTGLLRDADAAYLWLLCSADALSEGGSLAQLIEASIRFSGELAGRLRERVYESVIPQLAEGIVVARRLSAPTVSDLADTYEMALTVLFRLLFIAYAEDKDLLPYKWNGLYQRRSLKTKAREMLELVRGAAEFDDSDSLWEETARLFRAVEEGKPEWGVPAYNGGLFSRDPDVSRIGALLAQVSLPNAVFGPALRGLLLVDTPEGPGPVDFRSLSVHEFGTIYEGLLESELSKAETDLAVDENGSYRPCGKGEKPLVRKGEVYLHNASGARKSTGSYFTKTFAVEHLLERALDPALTDHIARLDAIKDDALAGERFFDFRVADIAMGSGHFLVAAVDHIERALSLYLSKRRLPSVVGELASVRAAAMQSLGSLADQVEIEDTQLLGRLIARRCIYGVDINPTAVHLARLAVWIHTFVPGLPLSFLDHNLVEGNSLVGISRLSEVVEKAEETSKPLFPIDARHMLGDASLHLNRLARITDSTTADLRQARRSHEQAFTAVAASRALCDIVTACRIDGKPLPIDVSKWEKAKGEIVGSQHHMASVKVLSGLKPLHFPIAFPEVFLRERQGFDVVVGNPPWQEATVEEDAFWARHSSGLRALSQRNQEKGKAQLRRERPDLLRVYEQELYDMEMLRRALTTGPYPGMGTGDPDLYKAFCWRFWNLISDQGGRIGVVLPRSALAAKGSTEFRTEIFDRANDIDITMLLNNRQWFFEDVHPQYTIGLVTIKKEHVDRTPVALRGPYASLDHYRGSVIREPAVFYGTEIKEWNDTASLPLLPTDESAEVFTQLRKAPRLDLDDRTSWRAIPHRELDATNDKRHMDIKSKDCPEGFWPVYKGESFDIWNPDTGTYYAWADPKVVLPVLQQKRLRGGRNKRSAFSEFGLKWLRDPATLPCLEARIAFRDVTNRTNRRTVIVALLPPKVVVANSAPFLLWPRGNRADEIFLLGVLSSLPLDWYARRFVETHVNFFMFDPFPVPRPRPSDPLRLRAVELAGRLACPDRRFAEWVTAVGVQFGPLDPSDKEDKTNELDAVVAHLYGLKEKHLCSYLRDLSRRLGL